MKTRLAPQRALTARTLDLMPVVSVAAEDGDDDRDHFEALPALAAIPGGSPYRRPHRTRPDAVLRTAHLGLGRDKLHPDTVLTLADGRLDQATPAPRPFASWSETRAVLRAALTPQGWPADRVVLIGDTHEERDWSQAARLAYYLPADRFFAA